MIGKEERRNERKKLKLDGLCRTMHQRLEVAIVDITSKGCGIVGKGLPLHIGQQIVLRPKGMEFLTGSVRWASETRAGVEFEYPLHPAVVDHLCQMHPGTSKKVELDLAA